MSTDKPWEGDWLYVTSPILPDLQEVLPMLQDMLERAWVTNQGPYARQLEEALSQRLEVPEVAVVTSGTAGLELAIKTLVQPGEVITTGYSFPATWHLLLEDPRWTPIFTDIDDRFCLAPDAVEAALTPRTTAILAVHAYGWPAQHARLSALADRAGIPLLYDAAPCMGTRVDGQGIAALGDLSVLSFHATKVYNTLEGGAVAGQADALAEVRQRRNFGLGPGGVPIVHGQNAKLDEVRAIFGLVALGLLDDALEARGRIERSYLERLHALGVHELDLAVDRLNRPGVEHNHAYFPVLVRPGGRVDRDGLFEHLRSRGILARRYFTHTIPTVPLYRGRYTPGSLPRTLEASQQVLCLPIHPAMGEDEVNRVVHEIGSAFGC